MSLNREIPCSAEFLCHSNSTLVKLKWEVKFYISLTRKLSIQYVKLVRIQQKVVTSYSAY